GGGPPTALTLLAAAWSVHTGMSEGPVQRAATRQADRAPQPASAPGPAGAPAPLPPATVTRIAIPALAVDVPVTALHLDAQGHLGTPLKDDRHLAGWWQEGPTPGSAGTAVAVGHRDTSHGPAAFYQLGALSAGDLITVTRNDQHQAVYTVDAVHTFDKARFPDTQVYGPTGRPELRLLTCGGGYHHGTGYDANTVVFAHLTGIRAIP
ncbi:class F sortase, partial [Streptomyces sp. PH10-H1]|uniref:class F sortase n=1 Tax=Streptomyces sp. PH10-H1 TaxID=3046212 RepID=UPI0032D8B738